MKLNEISGPSYSLEDVYDEIARQFYDDEDDHDSHDDIKFNGGIDFKEGDHIKIGFESMQTEIDYTFIAKVTADGVSVAKRGHKPLAKMVDDDSPEAKAIADKIAARGGGHKTNVKWQKSAHSMAANIMGEAISQMEDLDAQARGDFDDEHDD